VDDHTDLVELSYEECLLLLAAHSVGRLAVIAEPYPLLFPVNYRLVDGRGGPPTPGHTWIAIRTRPGNPIDRAPIFVSFEVDGIDHEHHAGWSVLVAGTMHRIDPDAADFAARFDPQPWLRDDRDRWLVIDPTRVTGRRLRRQDVEWAFPERAYL